MDEITQVFNFTFANIEKERNNILARIKFRLKQWHDMRRDNNLNSIIDEHHLHGTDCLLPVLHNNHECTVNCTGKIHWPVHTCNSSGGARNTRCQDNMILIDKDICLYGCNRSGKHHVCGAMVKSSSTILKSISDVCNDVLITDNAEHICIFSGVALAVSMTHYYQKSKNRTFLSTAMSSDNDNDDGNSLVLSTGSSPNSYEDAEASKTLTEFEVSKPARKIIILKINRNTGDTSISSSSSSSSSSSKPTTKSQSNSSTAAAKKKRTRRKPKGSPPDPVRKMETIRTLQTKASSIIGQLLYDKEAIKKITELRDNRFHNSFSKSVESYKKFCNNKKKYPLGHVIMEIYHGERSENPLPNKIDGNIVDQMLIDKYSKTCVRLWKTMRFKCRQKSCNYQQFVIGLLYMMQRGINKEGQVLIERNTFLEKYLPDKNDLRFYGENVKLIEEHRNRKRRREKSKNFAEDKDAPLLLLENQSSTIRSTITRSKKSKINSCSSSKLEDEEEEDRLSSTSSNSSLEAENSKPTRSYYTSHISPPRPNYKKDITEGFNYINTSIINCFYNELKRAADGTDWTDQDFLKL